MLGSPLLHDFYLFPSIRYSQEPSRCPPLLNNLGGLKYCSAQLEHGGDPSQHLNMKNFLALMEALGDADEDVIADDGAIEIEVDM